MGRKIIYHQSENTGSIVKKEKNPLIFSCHHKPLGKGTVVSEYSWDKASILDRIQKGAA